MESQLEAIASDENGYLKARKFIDVVTVPEDGSCRTKSHHEARYKFENCRTYTPE